MTSPGEYVSKVAADIEKELPVELTPGTVCLINGQELVVRSINTNGRVATVNLSVNLSVAPTSLDDCPNHGMFTHVRYLSDPTTGRQRPARICDRCGGELELPF